MLLRCGTQSDPSDQVFLRRPARREPREDATRAPLPPRRAGKDASAQGCWAEKKDEGVTQPVAGTPMARSTNPARGLGQLDRQKKPEA